MQIKIIFILITFPILNLKKQSQNIRIMTFNIHFGNTINNTFDISNISSLIQSTRSDIVCLQEVDKNWSNRSEFADLISIISNSTNLKHYLFCPIYNKTSSRGAQFPNEQFGTAILSRYKILEYNDYILSRWSSQPGDPQPGEPGFPSQFHGFGHLVLDVNGTNFSVYNTHLDYRSEPPEGYNETMRAIQVREMLNIIKFEYPTVLTGDMNADFSAKDVFEPLLQKFMDAWSVKGIGSGLTFPCVEPYIRIDYVLVGKNKKVEVVNAEVVETFVSDHLPVVVDLVVGE